MKSWDLFDTLVARWDRDPRAVFRAIETMSGVKGFLVARRAAEAEADKNDHEKIYDSIYEKLQARLGLSDAKRDELKEMELQYELDHSLPIMENVNKMKKSDIIISDVYLPEWFLKKLLTKNGILNYKKIYVSYCGKHTGTMWEKAPKTITKHIGDNEYADVKMAEKYSFKAELYVDTPSLTETILIRSGFAEVAKLVRVLRLCNPGGKYGDLWNEQATINIPVLVVVSMYLISKYGKNRRYLFSTREAANIKDIFDALYPDTDTHTWYVSRKCLREAHPDFVAYTLDLFKNSPVVVDMHGSGDTSNNFYDKIGFRPDYFFVVGYRRSEWQRRYHAILMRTGPGLWVEIEDMNQQTYGSVTDIIDGVPTFDNLRYNPEPVAHQRDCILKCIELIQGGFPLPTKTNTAVRVCVRDILLQMRKHKCAIHNHGIPHINDWLDPNYKPPIVF